MPSSINDGDLTKIIYHRHRDNTLLRGFIWEEIQLIMITPI